MLVVVPALLIMAVGRGGGERVASDPAPTTKAPAPSTPPASTGPVATRGLVTVIDSGAGPQMCLGPTTKIYPPQCTGPRLIGWDWTTLGRDMSQQQGAVRWGSYALTGTWDGASLSVTDAIPAALYDTMPAQPPAAPAPPTATDPARLEEIADRVRELPGVTDASVLEGRVRAHTTYDDGSLQAWADSAYGGDVVVVVSELTQAS